MGLGGYICEGIQMKVYTYEGIQMTSTSEAITEGFNNRLLTEDKFQLVIDVRLLT